jgi:sec-independent protein translocase protein TatA
MGFGLFETLLVLAIVILFFGAKRIPQIAKGIGEGIRNFRASVKEGEGEENQLTGNDDEDKRLPGD